MTIQTVDPRTHHVNDPSLQPFIQPTFDPADYLNATLPSLQVGKPNSNIANKPTNSAPLSEISGQTQTLLSTLNAQATRLTNALTQLTDEILRTGSRLAYEVEILRSETVNLGELLDGPLQENVKVFLPQGITVDGAQQREVGADTDKGKDDERISTENAAVIASEPGYLTNLKTLVHVRQQLDSVIQLFGQALHFALPPSTLQPQTTTSGFISISAPPTSNDTVSAEEQEKKGRENVKVLRETIERAIRDAEDLDEGFVTAGAKVAELRELCGLWKGTVEEKARLRFVGDLDKLAEETYQDEGRRRRGAGSGQAVRPNADGAHGGGERGGTGNRTQAVLQARATQKGSGFLDNLQRMRGS